HTPHFSVIIHSSQPAIFFFSTAPVTTKYYTLSLHDALPIYNGIDQMQGWTERISGDIRTTSAIEDKIPEEVERYTVPKQKWSQSDRKSTRLNSSHVSISYAVFCLKTKK